MRPSLRIRRFNENRAGNFVRVESVINTHVKRRKGRAHEYVGRRDRRSLQERVEVVRDGSGRARRGRRIAPSIARAIVPTRARQLGNFRLNRNPAIARCVTAAIEYHGRIAFPRTKEVEPATSDVNGSPYFGVSVSVPAPAYLLVDRSGDHQGQNEACKDFRSRNQSLSHATPLARISIYQKPS